MGDGRGTYEGGIYRAEDARLSDLAGRKILPIGKDVFPDVIRNNVFVDKSMLIADVLDSGAAAMLFCRPRRFGKSLNLSMLKCFFELHNPSDPAWVSAEELFCGLEVWEAEGGRFREHCGAYPVVRFSFNNAKDPDWEIARGVIARSILAEYARHAYLAESEVLTDEERERVARLLAQPATGDSLKTTLLELTQFLSKHHGKPAVVLIDEYDAPVMAGHTYGYYDEVVAFLKGWLTGALKSNDALAFAVLTGVQRISKESIFSDLNNLEVNTSLNVASDERYGFTDAEIRAIASYLDVPEAAAEAKKWYDGYRFGGIDVYNPWSAVNYFKHDCVPDVYWGNTSSNSVLGSLVANADNKMLKRLYALAEPGGTVNAPIDTRIVFPDLGVAPQAVWSMLYLAGYLTTDDTALPGDTERPRALRIPNREVAKIYTSEITGRFAQAAGGRDVLYDLHEALVAGDAEIFAEELEDVLLNCASFHDLASENSYHMLMMGLLFNVPGYESPVSNHEAGRGRFDIQLAPLETGRGPLITVELKHAAAEATPEKLSALASDALAQIEDRAYDAAADEGGTLRWGIAASGKSVAVACERS